MIIEHNLHLWPGRVKGPFVVGQDVHRSDSVRGGTLRKKNFIFPIDIMLVLWYYAILLHINAVCWRRSVGAGNAIGRP